MLGALIALSFLFSATTASPIVPLSNHVCHCSGLAALMHKYINHPHIIMLAEAHHPGHTTTDPHTHMHKNTHKHPISAHMMPGIVTSLARRRRRR
jgi:hypothetical protein